MTHKEDGKRPYLKLAEGYIEGAPKDLQTLAPGFGELISLLLQADAGDPNAEAAVIARSKDLEEFFNRVDAEYAAWVADGMPEDGLNDPIDLSTL